MRLFYRRSALPAIVAAAIIGAPLRATAQSPKTAGDAANAANVPGPDAVARAREHFTRGVKLYEEDDFRTALIEFNRAYELAPNWQVLYNIGQASYQLRDYAAALRTLEKYVAAGGATIAPDRRQQVDREMDELRGRVAHVTFSANVEGAEVLLDDVSMGSLPFRGPELVGAGRHRITATKAGWAPATRVVDIAGGDNLTLKLELREESRPEGLGPSTADAGSHAPSYAPALVVGGIGVAGVAVGAIFGILAINDHSTLNGECNATKQCPYGTQSEIDAFSRDGLVSTIGFAVGGVGILAAVVLYATERGKANESSPPAAAASLRVRPWVGAGVAGVAGTF